MLINLYLSYKGCKTSSLSLTQERQDVLIFHYLLSSLKYPPSTPGTTRDDVRNETPRGRPGFPLPVSGVQMSQLEGINPPASHCVHMTNSIRTEISIVRPNCSEILNPISTSCLKPNYVARISNIISN